jgi:hypothetical protein
MADGGTGTVLDCDDAGSDRVPERGTGRRTAAGSPVGHDPAGYGDAIGPLRDRPAGGSAPGAAVAGSSRCR